MINDYDFFPLRELQSNLEGKIGPMQMNKLSGAYDMAENAYSGKMFAGGPLFNHLTRALKIIVIELDTYDPDILIATLMSEIYSCGEDISPEIINLNFGAYVALLADYLDKFDEDKIDLEPENLTFEIADKIKAPGDDYLVIRLARLLDRIRQIEISHIDMPLVEFKKLEKRYFQLIESSGDKRLFKLGNLIKKERSKYLS